MWDGYPVLRGGANELASELDKRGLVFDAIITADTGHDLVSLMQRLADHQGQTRK